MSARLDILLVAIDAPDMPLALCRDRHELFDPPPAGDDPDERTQQSALDLCARCRELPRCAAWLASLPANQRPLGVVAGQVQQRKPRHKPSAPVPPVSPMRAAALAAIAAHEARIARKQ